MEIRDLQPSIVWGYFDDLCKIPRPSGHEERVAEYIEIFAASKGFAFSKDAKGNVFVRKSGKKPVIALQAHMDMVCEKNNGTVHDFLNDPIRAYVDGDCVTADGTTLGADDGIGVAMILAALDTVDREMECLFTVEEETSLGGAKAVSSDLFSAKEMINIDTGDEKSIIVGCAGMNIQSVKFALRYEDMEQGMFGLHLKIGGLAGGHSGEDIDKERGNAIKLLAVFLNILESETSYRLCSINGGGLSNAIPREAEAVVAVPFSFKEQARVLWNVYAAQVEQEWIAKEPVLSMEMESCPLPDKAFVPTVAADIVRFLTGCPHGVLEKGKAVAGVVDGSANLASVNTNGTEVRIVSSQRHFDMGKLQLIADEITALARKCNAQVEEKGRSDSWTPDFDNDLVKRAAEVYGRVMGISPSVMPIHAGLECACFVRRYPDMKAISIGPDMWAIHSPDERLSIASVGRIWKCLVEILAV